MHKEMELCYPIADRLQALFYHSGRSDPANAGRSLTIEGFYYATMESLFDFTHAGFVLISCSPIPPRVAKQAEPPVPFATLVNEAEKYKEKTVILGGYILGLNHLGEETLLCVLEVPLNAFHKPRETRFAEGKFTVSHKGFLSRQKYRLDQEVTVAGRVVGITARDVECCPGACLEIESLEIYSQRIEEPEYSPGYYDRSFDHWDSPFPQER